MSNPFFQDFEIHNNDLNVYNIVQYSEKHAIFNAGFISYIPVNKDISIAPSAGDVLLYYGTEITLATVVFPDPVPPARPITNGDILNAIV